MVLNQRICKSKQIEEINLELEKILLITFYQVIFFVELFVLPFNRISFDFKFSFCVCAGASCFYQHRSRSLISFVDTYNWMQQRANSTYRVASSFKASVFCALFQVYWKEHVIFRILIIYNAELSATMLKMLKTTATHQIPF